MLSKTAKLLLLETFTKLRMGGIVSREGSESRRYSDSKVTDAMAAIKDHCWCKSGLLVLLAIVTAPYRRTFKLYTWRPLKEMRAARGDKSILVPLIRQWKEEKYEELRSVQVSVSQARVCKTATNYRRPASVQVLQ